MKPRRWCKTCVACVAFVLLALPGYLLYASQGGTIAVGSSLPKIALEAPESAGAQQYLGLKSKDPFSLADIPAKLVVIEFLSAL